LGSHRDPHLMGAHFLVYRLISGNAALDVQPDGVLDELACFFLGLSLGLATLEGRTNSHKPAILVPLYHHREFVTPHRFATSDPIVPRLRSADCCLLTFALRRAGHNHCFRGRGLFLR